MPYGKAYTLTPEQKARKAYTAKMWRQRNKEKVKAIMRSYHKNLRLQVLAAYGGKCVCCGETIPEFLTFDHINGDGAAHRRMLQGGRRTGSTTDGYRWLKNNGYPKNIQILCYNCNCGKRQGAICPHEKYKQSEIK